MGELRGVCGVAPALSLVGRGPPTWQGGPLGVPLAACSLPVCLERARHPGHLVGPRTQVTSGSWSELDPRPAPVAAESCGAGVAGRDGPCLPSVRPGWGMCTAETGRASPPHTPRTPQFREKAHSCVWCVSTPAWRAERPCGAGSAPESAGGGRGTPGVSRKNSGGI